MSAGATPAVEKGIAIERSKIIANRALRSDFTEVTQKLYRPLEYFMVDEICRVSSRFGGLFLLTKAKQISHKVIVPPIVLAQKIFLFLHKL